MKRKAALGGLVSGMFLIAAAVAIERQKAASPEPAHAAEKVQTSATEPQSVVPRRTPSFSRPGSAGLPGRAVPMEHGRLLSAPRQGRDGKSQASIPELDEVLELDDTDEEWANRITEDARRNVPAAAGVRELTVKCAPTFCRVKIVRPTITSIHWHEIDEALAGIAKGEAIFSTQNDGEQSTGYLYIAKTHLPFSRTPLGPDRSEDTDAI